MKRLIDQDTSSMKKIAVILSGCGFKDGSEILESVSTFISISQQGASYSVFAPDINIDSVDHISDEKSEKRNSLKESARISRGKIDDIKKLNINDFDAVVFPGGFGVITTLCDFSTNGAKAHVNIEIERIIKGFHKEGKPIGAFCIAPALIACVLGSKNIALTIGDDKKTFHEIEKTGADHIICSVDDYVTDRENKIITSPAYMIDSSPDKIFSGINKALKELVEMA